jgi:sulfite exporter TauE/SafE/copper chaperone CopZ
MAQNKTKKNDYENHNKNGLVTVEFKAKETVCKGCERTIIAQAKKIKGVQFITFDYSTEKGKVTFDEKKTSIKKIFDNIEEKGYECSLNGGNSKNNSKEKTTLGTIFSWIFIIVAIIIIGYFLLLLIDKIPLPELTPNISLGLLFVIGLLTGFHCVAMCGGFVVGYTAKAAQEGRDSKWSHLKYGFGKTLSYTIIGGLFGLLGSFIAFTPTLRGVLGIIAGLFLLIFGLNMLNVFPSLRKFQIRTPMFISKFVHTNTKESSSPFFIGLFNGLMLACGPLQAMYVMAAASGSFVMGAKLLFVFGVGTLPVMLGFGFFTTFLSKNMTRNILKFSGIIVILLGILMLNTGLALTGSGYDAKSVSSKLFTNNGYNSNNVGNSQITNQNGQIPNNVAVQKNGYQEIHMDVTASGWSPDTFVLKKGVPVHWIINAKEITNCNHEIQVPAYNLVFDLKQGEQTIAFTPDKSGTISWSCWMGMIPGTFIVKDDLSNTAAIQQEVATQPAKKTSGTCGLGGSGGGCGCGMMG